MNLNAFRALFFDTLKNRYELEEAQGLYALLLREKLGITRAEAVLQQERILDAPTESGLKQILKRLENHEPIQYILNRAYFCGFPFILNANVLIPRPETEELVYWVVSEYEKIPNKNIRVLDIGTGSGCIAVSLAKLLPEAAVSAMDISKDALRTAHENAIRNHVQVEFINVDILKTGSLNTAFEVIVSNPPYVLDAEKSKMRENVLNFEPHEALFVPDTDPLIFYEKISGLAIKYLNQNGQLFFEINEAYGNEVRDLLTEKGFTEVELKADLYGKNRMVKGRKP